MEYLGPYATIVGIDIDPRTKSVEQDQISVRIGSQDDPEFLHSVLDEFGAPDIVLDDGSHEMEHVNATFDFLYPKISRNGVYLVEDMHTAYWPTYGGGKGKKDTFIEKAKDIVDQINGDHWENRDNPFIDNTLSVSFYESMVVLERGAYGDSKLSIETGTKRL